MSGPILDRIDLHINVPFVETEKLKQDKAEGEKSKTVRERVAGARKIQEKRFEKETGIFSNGEMRNKQIKKYCRLSEEAEKLLQQAAEKWQLSARSYFRVIKVSQTIADLGGSESIEYAHVAEASQYRMRA